MPVFSCSMSWPLSKLVLITPGSVPPETGSQGPLVTPLSFVVQPVNLSADSKATTPAGFSLTLIVCSSEHENATLTPEILVKMVAFFASISLIATAGDNPSVTALPLTSHPDGGLGTKKTPLHDSPA